MIERIRRYFYQRRARRCEQLGHERSTFERLVRRDGLWVIEQMIQCERCHEPLSDWFIVLTEASGEAIWKKSA